MSTSYYKKSSRARVKSGDGSSDEEFIATSNVADYLDDRPRSTRGHAQRETRNRDYSGNINETVPREDVHEQHQSTSKTQVRKYKAYNYNAIPKAQGSIRLFRLHPSSLSDLDVECELFTTNFTRKGAAKYEALSWCWGAANETSRLLIREGFKVYAKTVCPNLLRALRSLRYHHKDRMLWIDAICINQDDLDEKSHQVAMMDEIYRNAHKVCIWLGDATKSSDLALEFIRDEVSQLRNFNELFNTADAKTKWVSIMELMQLPWFSRRWVVQELALAQTATLYCGRKSISWEQFAVAVELFIEAGKATNGFVDVFSPAAVIPGFFEHVAALGASLLVNATARLFKEDSGWYKLPADDSSLRGDVSSSSAYSSDDSEDPESYDSQPPSTTGSKKIWPQLTLEFLVTSLTMFETTIPHDTVYALLAISKDVAPSKWHASNHGLRPNHLLLAPLAPRTTFDINYQLPYVDVCKKFTQFAIRRSWQVDPTRALDVMCRPWATTQKILEQRKKTNAEKLANQLVTKITEEYEERDRRKRFSLGSRYHSPEASPRQRARRKARELVKNQVHVDKEDMVLPSWVPQRSQAPHGMFLRPGVTGAFMSRMNADPLVGPAGSALKPYSAAGGKRLAVHTLKFRKRPDLGHFSMYVQGFVLDSIESVEQTSLNGQIPAEWAALAGWGDTKGKPPDSFWRTLVADRGPDGKEPPFFYSRACQECFKRGGYQSGAVNTSDLIIYEKNPLVSQFCHRVQATIWNRALAKTKFGRLCLISKEAQVGDCICILYGSSVPVVLRKSDIKTYDVIEREMLSDVEYLVKMMIESFIGHKERKRQHELRKRAEMAELVRQWLKRSRWFSDQILNRKRSVDLDLIKETIHAFNAFRADNRKHEWPNVFEQEILGSGRGTFPRKPTHMPGRWEGNHEEYGFVYDMTSDGTRIQRRLVDWWEFEYQLKAGRRWRDIVKERKHRREREWERIMSDLKMRRQNPNAQEDIVANGHKENPSTGTDTPPVSFSAPQHEQAQATSIRPNWVTMAQRDAKLAVEWKERKKLFRNRPKIHDSEKPTGGGRTEQEEQRRYEAMRLLIDTLKEQRGDDRYFSYQMLGECYVHGMMDGEAILLQNEGDGVGGHFPSTAFEIR